MKKWDEYTLGDPPIKECCTVEVKPVEDPASLVIEQLKIATTFSLLLSLCTRDGAKKREAGTKVPWYVDPEHEAAIFSHLDKWKHGAKTDGDSGAHPLVHLAWRALAIAYQETYGKVKP